MQLTNKSYGEEPFDTSYRLFVDMNQQRYRTVGLPIHIVKLTQPVYVNSTNIYVSNGSVLGTPDPMLAVPGIIYVNGERIVYFEKDGNRLGRLRRGVGGTGTPLIHLNNSDVEDVGPNRYNGAPTFVPEAEFAVFPTYRNVPEGTAVRFVIETHFVEPGTTLYWTNGGTSQVVDFLGYNTGYTNSGSFIITGAYRDGEGYVDLTPRSDNATEGTETIIFQVRIGGIYGTVVATSEVVYIEDLSIIPEYNIEPRANTVAEGSSIIFDVTTKGIADKTTFWWTNQGTSIETDFVVQQNYGDVTVYGDYRSAVGYIKLDTVRSLGYSSGKSITLDLREGSPAGPILITANVVYITDLPDPQYQIRATALSTKTWAGNNQVLIASEGETIDFDFFTVGVDPNTLFYYQFTGNATVSNDYYNEGNTLIGGFKTTGTIFGASANVQVRLVEDVFTELGTETLIFNVYSTRSLDSASYIIGPVTVGIEDTSVSVVVNVSAVSVNIVEGQTAKFLVTTDGIKPGATLWWTRTGTVVDNDLASGSQDSQGTLTLSGTYRNGKAEKEFKTLEDLSPSLPDPEEGPETIIFTVYLKDPSSSPAPLPAAPPVTVTVADTSKATTTTTQAPASEPVPGEVLPFFFNGDFEIATPRTEDANGVEHIPGWSIYSPGKGTTANHLRMNGFSTILGCATPPDPTPTYQARTNRGSTPAPYGDEPEPVAGYQYFFEIVKQAVPPRAAVTNVMRLYSDGNVKKGFGIVRGPYLVADNPIQCNEGDLVVFSWKAEAGGDDFDIIAYLLEVGSCRTVLLLDSSSKQVGAKASPWSRVEKKISASETGTFQFVFVSGSQDDTGGMALGASLFLDDITKIPATPPPDPWKITVDPPVDKTGGDPYTFNVIVPSDQPQQTIAWFAVKPSTNVAFVGTGITGLNLGAPNNLPILAGPSSVKITMNTNAISGADQTFQLLITNGLIGGTELTRTGILTIKAPGSAAGVAPLWALSCLVCKNTGGSNLSLSWAVNAGVINVTASWFAVDKGTNTPFTGTGLPLSSRGSSNNLPNITGPIPYGPSAQIILITTPVSSLQEFEIIIVEGPLPSDKLLVRSQTLSITV